jgi:hypothetical protein
MPKKKASGAKSSPATSVPEPPNGRAGKAAKSPARSALTGDGSVAAAEGAALPARKAATRPKSAAKRRPAPSRSNPAPTAASDDRFRDAVSRLAYHFWEARACPEASPDDDWLRAESAVREVLKKLSSASA